MRSRGEKVTEKVQRSTADEEEKVRRGAASATCSSRS